MKNYLESKENKSR